jgi:hypothetical protein
MTRLVSIFMLLLLCAAAHADTFELSDPAAEMYKEREEWDARQAEREREETAVCTYDAKSDRCYCIDRQEGRPVPMEREECMARAPQPLDSQQP